MRFHGVRRELIERQADALGIPLLQSATTPATFEAAFLEGLLTLRDRGVTAVAFGDIHLADVRAWYEERTTGLGLEHVEPIWGEDTAMLVREGVLRGYRAIVTGTDPRARRAWLGRTIDEALAAEIVATGIDAAGENGEYHTFAYDGPLFRRPVTVRAGEIVEREGHAQIDLI